MLDDPQHHLAPRYRRAIYKAFGPWAEPPACRVQAWLAILAAERVLPIYYAESPTAISPRPDGLISLARRVARERLTRDAEEVEDALEQAYHSYGHLWVSTIPIPRNVYLAVSAAYDALLEASAVAEPLSYLSDIYLLAADGQVRRGDTWSDEELAGGGSADAASSAAIAYARSPQNMPTAPQKLRAFWEWWLTKAIPTAWRWASTSDEPVNDAPSIG
jgi:hypothetical protein